MCLSLQDALVFIAQAWRDSWKLAVRHILDFNSVQGLDQ